MSVSAPADPVAAGDPPPGSPAHFAAELAAIREQLDRIETMTDARFAVLGAMVAGAAEHLAELADLARLVRTRAASAADLFRRAR